MAEIKYPTGKDMTREFIFRHTVARGESLKKLPDGTLIKLDSVCSYINDDGDKIVSIIGRKWNADANAFEEALTHFASNSSIFREDLQKIVEVFGDKDVTIRIRNSVSKSGRTFVFCDLA